MSSRPETADKMGRGPSLMSWASTLDATEEAVELDVLRGLAGAQVEGESDLVVELIDLYAEDSPRRLDTIRGALAAGDLEALQWAAHSLKGSSTSLGAQRVGILCEKLERVSGREWRQGGEILLARLERELARAWLAFASERTRRRRG